MKRWWKLLLTAVLVGAIAVVGLTTLRADPVPVTVFRVARGSVEDSVTNSRAGTVESRIRASLSAELGGRVASLVVEEGQRVRAGELLLKLADAEYRAEVELRARAVETAGAVRAEACHRARQAEREYVRLNELYRTEIVSEDIVDQAESARDASRASCSAATARIGEANAALELARTVLNKTVMTAPFDAVVAELTAEVGEWITPSPPGLPIPPVVELYDPEAIYVNAPLDEVDIAKVQAGQTVRVTLDAYPGQSYDGRVARVAAFVLDRLDQNRTFEIEVDLTDRHFARRLLPGTSADVEVILDMHADVLRVPSYALIEGGQVLVVRADRLVAVDVETGLRNWQFTEITSGLEPDDRVVVSLDRVEVQAGAEVVVTDETDR